MIEYVEIRNFNTRKIEGIIDTAKSIIWASEFFGVGSFEIYAVASKKNIQLLQVGKLVTRYNDVNVGMIEEINVNWDALNGMMITASGHFAKCLLSRRIIYTKASTYSVAPTILSGLVASAAMRLVDENCINSTSTQRNFSLFKNAPLRPELDAVITGGDGTASKIQVTYDNLLTYTDELLQKYGYAARVILDDTYLAYDVYGGDDKCDSLIFSREYDNLTSSSYTYNTENLKTTAIVGGQGEGLERFVAIASNDYSGYNRRELWVDDNQQARTVKEDEEEHTYTDAEYNEILTADGALKLSDYVNVENFAGEIDLIASGLTYGVDFNLGDLIRVFDSVINKTAICRIIKVNEVEDENGYNITAEYETV